MSAVVATGACVSILAAAASADAAITCTYDPVSRTATASANGSPTDPGIDGIYRDGDQIKVSFNQACGAATVFNTDTIVVNDVSASGSMGNHSPDIGTNFAPGFTDEPGSSDEIELVLNYGSGRDGLIMFPVRAGPGPHFLTAGRGLLNLNAQETDGIDADVTLNGVDFVTIFLNAAYGGTTGDEIRGDGGDGTGADLFPGELSVAAGPGDDLLIGGSGDDFFAGEDGADRIYARGGRDQAYGGSGADLLFGERGRDRLWGDDGNDDHDGGPGRDFCSGDRGRDSFASCEQREG